MGCHRRPWQTRQHRQLDRLRLYFLFEALPTRVIEASELTGAGLEFEIPRNLNTAADYAAALRDAGLQR